MLALQFAILGSSALFISVFVVVVIAIAAYFGQFTVGILGVYSIVGYVVVVSKLQPYVTIMYALIVLLATAASFQIYNFFTGGGV